MAGSDAGRSSTPAGDLESLVNQALAVAKKARKHRKRLAGDNFYGNKLAELRADATNAFRRLAARSAGDSSALAELVEVVFATATSSSDRLDTARELTHALRTTWRTTPPTEEGDDADGLFPLAILDQAKRGYLISIGRQVNGAFRRGWYDACAVMMRRLLEIAIIEAFEARGLAAKIRDSSDNYLQLSDLVDRALKETTWSLSRNARKYLPQLRDVGHQSAHGRYFLARSGDLERLRAGCRVVIEEFLHHASLL
jgi:hypothetical protein